MSPIEERMFAALCDFYKEQAAHDRARDRHLLKLGIVTARFTGSEIHRDAERCAVDAFEVLLALYDAQCGADVSIWMDAHDAGLAKAAEG